MGHTENVDNLYYVNNQDSIYRDIAANLLRNHVELNEDVQKVVEEHTLLALFSKSQGPQTATEVENYLDSDQLTIDGSAVQQTIQTNKIEDDSDSNHVPILSKPSNTLLGNVTPLNVEELVDYQLSERIGKDTPIRTPSKPKHVNPIQGDTPLVRKTLFKGVIMADKVDLQILPIIVKFESTPLKAKVKVLREEKTRRKEQEKNKNI